ncbi:hypothetical protein K6025_01855 [Ehrlichia sp. JZT12]
MLSNSKESQLVNSTGTGAIGSSSSLSSISLLSDHQEKHGLSTKLNEVDFDKIFVQISFIMLLVEVSSSVFNLVSTYVPVSERIKYILTIAFYIVHTILTLCMITSSILAIKKAADNKKCLLDSPCPLDSDKKLQVHQNNIQISENFFTIISHILWTTVCLSSLTMLLKYSIPKLEQACLWLSIISPILCIASCLLRVSDAAIESKRSNSDNQKKQAKSLILLYSTLVFFEAVHCACHIFEAINLNGKLQNIYDFQNKTVLCLEIATILIFIGAFFVENHFRNKAKQVQEDDVSSLLRDNMVHVSTHVQDAAKA